MTTFRTGLARYLRRTMTDTQRRIWDRLSARQLGGWKFRRQHPIGPYIVDFYCPAAHLVLEISGPTDDGPEWPRRAFLERSGYRVMYVSPDDVQNDLDGVILEIHGELLEQGLPTPPIRPLARTTTRGSARWRPAPPGPGRSFD
ncbi:MAG TPA: DUF559 domain-containing protein [Candidatus Dormibacteraeota bacterium]|nr:DUF559 domain-containing protein [Candidatus Dormibacteraeota bacterium]